MASRRRRSNSVASCSRSERAFTVYERPLEVDWNRRVDKVLTFGNGVHRCPGAVLGRNELVIGLQEWLKRIPDFEVAPNARMPVLGGTVAKILELPLVW